MNKTETLADFYQNALNQTPQLQPGAGHFNVFNLADCVEDGQSSITYNRRDYYKILLIRGNNRYHYADKSTEVSGTTLQFFNPQVPYTWESLS